MKLDSFNRRSLINNETLGQKLKRQREQTNYQIGDVAALLAIKPEYLMAIENSDYRSLPSRVFVKNYVKNYTKFLQLDWAVIEPILNQELSVYEVQPDIPTLKRYLTAQPLRLVRVASLIGIIFLILAIGAYFVFEIGNIVQPPELILSEVPTTIPAEQRFVTITGQTDVEAIVSINDQVIPVQTDGHFSQNMALQTGSNVFKVISKTKRSRPNIQFLQIFVEK